MKNRYSVLMLILCLLPINALAAIEPSQGVVRSGSTITLSGEYEEYTISGPEENVSITIESGVKSLILHGVSITAPEGQDALMAKDSLQLNVTAANTITGGSSYADGGGGIVLPPDGELTINGIGSLNVRGGDALYERNDAAIDGKGGTAIVGSVNLQANIHVTVTGGSCQSGYHEERVTAGHGIDGNVIINDGRLTAAGGSSSNAYSNNTGGHGITGNAIVNSGLLTATGGLGAEGRTSNKGGDGVHGSATVNRGQLNATGGKAYERGSTFNLTNSGGHGVCGDAEVNGGQLTAAGGLASGGEFTSKISSRNLAGHGVLGNAEVNGGQLTATGAPASGGNPHDDIATQNLAGHGVNGNAVLKAGQLIATGSSASSPTSISEPKNTGGNGVNGAFTAAGGYALLTGGEGDASRMGKAAAATDQFRVRIGSSGKFLSASAGEDSSPEEPLNEGKLYTEATDVTDEVSGKRSLETKEHFAVTYSCAYDGCENTYTDYADGSRTYTVKTPESIGFDFHMLAFAGFVDSNGNLVDSLTVSGPISLKASWKVVFTFDAGEGGQDSVPPLSVITSSNTVRLPECGITAPAGYQFAGWKIDGDDTIYAVGDEMPAAGEIHLIAVWKPIPISVPPSTGDSSLPVLWALLCLGSCAMLLLRRSVWG
ncbi:MAG: hypothetical protein IKJ26_05895 [Clostridia bacterium]|nr:hypothetical protein [Clostridia bacterium]